MVARCCSGEEGRGVGQEAVVARAISRAVLVGVERAWPAHAGSVWVVQAVAGAAHAGRGVGVAGGKGVFVGRGAGGAGGIAENWLIGVARAFGAGAEGVVAKVAGIAEAVGGGGGGCSLG